MIYVHFNVISSDPRNHKEFLFASDLLRMYCFNKLAPIYTDRYTTHYVIINQQIPDLIWEAMYGNSALAELFKKVHSSYDFPIQLVKVTVLRTL